MQQSAVVDKFKEKKYDGLLCMQAKQSQFLF